MSSLDFLKHLQKIQVVYPWVTLSFRWLVHNMDNACWEKSFLKAILLWLQIKNDHIFNNKEIVK